MSLKHFYTANTATGLPSGYIQLRNIYVNYKENAIIGCFVPITRNWNLSDGHGQAYMQCTFVKMGRSGKLVNASGANMGGFYVQLNPNVSQSDQGKILRRPSTLSSYQPFDTLTALFDSPEVYYEIDTNFPSTILTRPRISLASLYMYGIGATFINRGIVVTFNSGTTPQLIENPGSIVRYPSGLITFPRDIFPIGSNKVAVIYYPSSPPLSSIAGFPARIAVFSITNSTYTLDFVDNLPELDDVAGYDADNNIIYSTNRYTRVLHASYLERAPASVGTPTIVSAGVASFRELQATQVSTVIRDELGSAISNLVVRWSLTSQVSQGYLNSAYSLTNNSGVATITYVGPMGPSATLVETLTAEVSTTD